MSKLIVEIHDENKVGALVRFTERLGSDDAERILTGKIERMSKTRKFMDVQLGEVVEGEFRSAPAVRRMICRGGFYYAQYATWSSKLEYLLGV